MPDRVYASASLRQTKVFVELLEDFVALAGLLVQLAAIINGDRPAASRDRAQTLECCKRYADRGAVGADGPRQKVVSRSDHARCRGGRE